MKVPFKYIVALCLLTEAACGTSPPMNFYTLTPRPATALASVKTPVRLVAVTIPKILDRPSIVRSGGQEGEVTIAAQDRWAAPLDELLQQTLSEDLAVRLTTGGFIPLNAPDPDGGPPVRSLSVAISRFDSDASGHVVLDAYWSVTGQPGRSGTEHVQIDGSAVTYQDTVAALSEALAVLADRMSLKL